MEYVVEEEVQTQVQEICNIPMTILDEGKIVITFDVDADFDDLLTAGMLKQNNLHHPNVPSYMKNNMGSYYLYRIEGDGTAHKLADGQYMEDLLAELTAPRARLVISDEEPNLPSVLPTAVDLRLKTK